MLKHVGFAIGNSLAVLLLLALGASPFYFAKNFSQVAGVKSESTYLLVSQVSKFPGMTFTENTGAYSLKFTKQAESQAYLSVLVINNPTAATKTYNLAGGNSQNTVFFGENLNNLQTSLKVPPDTSVPVSLISNGTSSVQTVTFTIESN